MRQEKLKHTEFRESKFPMCKLTGIRNVEVDRIKSQEYLTIIAEKLNLETEDILSAKQKSTRKLIHAKIFYTWLIQEKFDLSFSEIRYFTGKDYGDYQYFCGRHSELLLEGDSEEKDDYYDLCAKLSPLFGFERPIFIPKDLSKGILFSTKNQFVLPVSKLHKINPICGAITKDNEDFVAGLIIERICKVAEIDYSLLVSKDRHTPTIWGRCTFYTIIKEFLPKITLARMSQYVGIKIDHAKVLNGLKRHNKLLGKKNYRALYTKIYIACYDIAPLGSNNFPLTVNGFINYLRIKNVQSEVIADVEQKITKKAKEVCILPIDLVQETLNSIGIK